MVIGPLFYSNCCIYSQNFPFTRLSEFISVTSTSVSKSITGMYSGYKTSILLIIVSIVKLFYSASLSEFIGVLSCVYKSITGMHSGYKTSILF